jgi:hypothetical protein
VRSILLLAAVAVISLLAGIAVTGLPEDVPDDVVSSAISVTPTTPTTTTAVTTTEVSTSAVPELSAATTTDSRPQATTGATTTGPTTSTTLAALTSLRVLVANAGGAPGVASRTAQELRALGYTMVSATNATRVRPDTIIVHATGREAEAGRLAAQLGLSPQQIAPQSGERLTTSGSPADLVVLLGSDRT